MTCCFYSCTNLVQVSSIPQGVTDISDCFAYCTSLVQAPLIPESVTGMGYSFSNCTSLVQAPVIPESAEIMTYCFAYCTKLEQVTLLCNYDNYRFSGIFKDCSALQAGGIKVKSTFYDSYTADGALNKMIVPGDTIEEKRAKFSKF